MCTNQMCTHLSVTQASGSLKETKPAGSCRRGLLRERKVSQDPSFVALTGFRAVLSLWSQRPSYSQQNQTQVDLSPKFSASHHGFKLQSVFPERNLLPSHPRSACPWNSSCAIPASFWIFPQTVPPPKSVSKSLRQKGCSS